VLTNALLGPSASEVTILWRYTNLFIIIIIMIIIIISVALLTENHFLLWEKVTTAFVAHRFDYIFTMALDGSVVLFSQLTLYAEQSLCKVGCIGAGRILTVEGHSGGSNYFGAKRRKKFWCPPLFSCAHPSFLPCIAWL